MREDTSSQKSPFVSEETGEGLKTVALAYTFSHGAKAQTNQGYAYYGAKYGSIGIQGERWFARTELQPPAKQSLLWWPCPLPSNCTIPVLWQNLELNVYCLMTDAHSRTQPVPSLTLSRYSLPLTATIPATARRLINIKRPSCLEPRSFLTGTCSLTTRSPSPTVGWLWAKHHISSGPSANRNSHSVPSGQGAAMPRATPGYRTRMTESRGKELTPRPECCPPSPTLY